MNMILQQYQSRVLAPQEPVDYSAAIMQSYPPQAVQMEPFIGFKVLCRDTNASSTSPADRIRQIDMNLGILRGKGCIIRETSSSMPDGFWIISMPVPRSQVNTAINNLMDVIVSMEQYFGIVRHGLFEINVSGRCNIAETERCLSALTIPMRYMSALIEPTDTAYRLGHVIRINDNFMVLRTRWNLQIQNNMMNYEDLVVLSQLISTMFK